MNKYLAEMVGTYVLVFGGVGAAVLAGGKIGYLGVSFAFGLSLLAMAYTIGPVSGCHVNPAVTIGMLMSKKISSKDAAFYVVAQIFGAILASVTILIIAKGAPGGYDPVLSGMGANGFGLHSPGGYSLGSAFLAEVVLTALLVFTVLGTTDLKAPVGFAGIPIGLVLVLIHLVGIPITNTSVNPARSIGPALFVQGWAMSQLWLFVVAPIFGAAVASLFYSVVRGRDLKITTTQAESALATEQAERVREVAAG